MTTIGTEAGAAIRNGFARLRPQQATETAVLRALSGERDRDVPRRQSRTATGRKSKKGLLF